MSPWILRHHRLTTWRVGRQMFGFSGDLPPARGFVVGEAPGPNTDPRTPLFPHPENSSAARMMRYANMTHEQYLGRLERINQCTEEWDDLDAKIRHRQIMLWLMTRENQFDGRPLRVLLLGKRVARTWGIHDTNVSFDSRTVVARPSPMRGFGYFRLEDVQIVYAPHPSGMNHVYNDESNRDRLGRYLRWTAGLFS